MQKKTTTNKETQMNRLLNIFTTHSYHKYEGMFTNCSHSFTLANTKMKNESCMNER